jgi:hypothetical protein
LAAASARGRAVFPRAFPEGAGDWPRAAKGRPRATRVARGRKREAWWGGFGPSWGGLGPSWAASGLLGRPRALLGGLGPSLGGAWGFPPGEGRVGAPRGVSGPQRAFSGGARPSRGASSARQWRVNGASRARQGRMTRKMLKIGRLLAFWGALSGLGKARGGGGSRLGRFRGLFFYSG